MSIATPDPSKLQLIVVLCGADFLDCFQLLSVDLYGVDPPGSLNSSDLDVTLVMSNPLNHMNQPVLDAQSLHLPWSISPSPSPTVTVQW